MKKFFTELWEVVKTAGLAFLLYAGFALAAFAIVGIVFLMYSLGSLISHTVGVVAGVIMTIFVVCMVTAWLVRLDVR